MKQRSSGKEDEDGEMDEDGDNGMTEDKDDNMNGEYKIDEGGDTKHWTFFIEHFAFCYFLVCHEHSDYWQK